MDYGDIIPALKLRKLSLKCHQEKLEEFIKSIEYKTILKIMFDSALSGEFHAKIDGDLVKYSSLFYMFFESNGFIVKCDYEPMKHGWIYTVSW